MIVTSQKIDLLRKLLGAFDADRRGINVQFWCPLCQDADPRKRKLAVRIEDGAAHCWVCGWKSRSIVSIVPRVGMRELLPELVAAYGEPSASYPAEEEPPARLALPDDLTLVGRLFERGSRDPAHRACLAYLASRGVTPEVAWSYRLAVSGEDALRRRVVFPSFDALGEPNYWTARAVADFKPKYLNSEASRLGVVFDEIDVDWERELTIVEGPFDLLSCHGLNATAALGSWLDDRYALFKKVVHHRTPVVLAFDPDAAAKQDKVANALMRYGVRVRAVSWKGMPADVDPSKAGATTFRRLVKDAPILTTDATFLSKVTRALGYVRLV